MTDQQPVPSPGWYPDRITPGMNRWWDGTQWTSHTQPATPAATPAAAAPVVTPAAVATSTPADATVASAVPTPAPAPGTPASPYETPAAVPGYVRPPARNGVAYTSFAFGILGMIFAIIDFVPGNHQIFFGLSGIVAITSGVRALTRRRFGQVSVLWPEVVGIVLGSLSTLIFIILLVANAALGGFE